MFEITEENKNCYAIIKSNKNSKYYVSDNNDFYIFRKGEKYNVLNVNNYFEEKIQTETNGKIDLFVIKSSIYSFVGIL